MFTTIFSFEISQWKRNPLPYIFACLVFCIAFLTMWGMASEGKSDENALLMNSYYRINNLSNYLSLLLLFLLPIVIGDSIFKDYKSRMFTLIYSYPITKTAYLTAKFFSAFIIILIVVSAMVLGFLLGTLVPGVNLDLIAPFEVGVYLQLFGYYLLPNMFLFGVIVFAVVVYTRNIYLGFISIILFVILQAALGALLSGNDLQQLAAILDPLGDKAIRYHIRYWSIAEKNALALPMGGIILVNRIFWLIISSLIAILAYRKFAFQQFVAETTTKNQNNIEIDPIAQQRIFHINLPKTVKDFSLVNRLKTIWKISTMYFKFIVWNWPFLAILLSGLLMIIFQQNQMNSDFNIAFLPTTARMLKLPMFFFTGIINFITFLYMGVLIYRGKNNRFDALIDIAPQPDWVLLFPKFLAILRVQFFLLSLVIISGIFVQLLNGYYRLELGHYLFELFVLQFVHFAIWSCLALFLHTLVKNMYLGFFLLIVIPMSITFIPEIGILLNIQFLQEGILVFNNVPGAFIGFDYSDLSGYGSFLPKYFLYKSYWVLAGSLLLLFSLFLWKRGLSYSFKERYHRAKQQFTGTKKWGFLVLLAGFLSFGSSIYYLEHVGEAANYNQQAEELFLLRNEKQYARYESMLQPRISKAKINMDLFPADRNFHAQGKLFFVNKVDQLIDTILVARSFNVKTTYQIEQAHLFIIKDDSCNSDLLILNKGLALGDTLTLSFSIVNFPNSTLHHNSDVFRNGTFIGRNILPKLGFRNAFISDPKKRKKLGLKERLPKEYLPTDSSLLGYRFEHNDMDRLEYECVLSTSSDQQAFTMGNLINSWTEHQRNYYHYKSDGFINNGMSWMSGRYDSKKDSINDLTIEAYFHPEHAQSFEPMLQGMKSAIAYNSALFGPLTHQTLKIVEFPINFGTHATLNGNLVPYSESLLLCDAHDKDNTLFNFPFLVAAHEVAHYWWAHRVDPANVKGAKLITESMCEYIALKMVEQKYGRGQLRKMLSNYRNLYLQARANKGNENPLNLVDQQQDYIAYQKGALALYTLSDYIGEDKLNEAFITFEKVNRFSAPPYPTSIDFLNTIVSVVPDSMQYLINDLFQTITFYDNKLMEVNIEPTPAGKYVVNIKLRMTKYRTDRNGKKQFYNDQMDSFQVDEFSSMPLADYIQIGFFKKNDADLTAVPDLLKTVKIEQIKNQFSFILDEEPRKIEIDPYFHLMDIDVVDNVWSND